MCLQFPYGSSEQRTGFSIAPCHWSRAWWSSSIVIGQSIFDLNVSSGVRIFGFRSDVCFWSRHTYKSQNWKENWHFHGIWTMSSTSNKRHKYTAQFKLRVVQFAEKSSNSKAGREFGVNEKLVRDWRRNVDKLQSMPRKKCADRGKKCYWPALEDEVVKWVTEQRQDGYIEKTFTPAGNMRAASLTTVCEWVKDTWQNIPSEMVVQSLKKSAGSRTQWMELKTICYGRMVR